MPWKQRQMVKRACILRVSILSIWQSSILGCQNCRGIDIIRTVREDGKTFPILILTARDRWQDKVDGLSAGADDYVAKPFHVEEIIARVNALLRRLGWLGQCGAGLWPCGP